MTLRRVTLIFLILYLIATLEPFVLMPFHIPPAHWITIATTLFGFTFALLHAGQRDGWSRALQLLGLVFVVSLLFESVGVATGWIYGPYHYTGRLGPLFLGLVPFLIPVAWFMMSYPSYIIADRLVPTGWRPWQRLLAVAAVGGIVMTAWDLVMDPFMVKGGSWVWDSQGAYFGIPLQNYWGWWLTVFTTFALYGWITARSKAALPASNFDRWALVAYLITMVGAVLAAWVVETSELALIGLFAMLPWPVAGFLKIT
jgi:putative membrane protein